MESFVWQGVKEKKSPDQNRNDKICQIYFKICLYSLLFAELVLSIDW